MRLPETVKFDMQPYGMVTLANLRVSPNPFNENSTMCFDITGDVIDGVERGYLCGHVSTNKATGTRTIRGVAMGRELRPGHVIVRVAM